MKLYKGFNKRQDIVFIEMSNAVLNNACEMIKLKKKQLDTKIKLQPTNYGSINDFLNL